MSQPDWKLIANLGDVNPIDYGGYFVYRDRTGVYTEEAELLIADCDDSPDSWTVYRFPLDRCTLTDGVLSDNGYHPEYPAWFADSLDGVASMIGQDPAELRSDLCSADPLVRARAYQAIGEYHGFENLDSYPLTFTSRSEVKQRYAKDTEKGNKPSRDSS